MTIKELIFVRMFVLILLVCFGMGIASLFAVTDTVLSPSTILPKDFTLIRLDTNRDGTGLRLDEDFLTTFAATGVSTLIDADGDTKVQVEESADEDIIRFDTFGTERMRIEKDGCINHYVAGGDYAYNVISDGVAAWFNAYSYNSTAPGLASGVSTYRARGTEAAKVIISADDLAGYFGSAGWDGVSWRPLGGIQFEVDGTPGVGDMPGRLVLKVTADGAAGMTEAMRISNAGYVGINNTNPSYRLDVDGEIRCTDSLTIDYSEIGETGPLLIMKKSRPGGIGVANDEAGRFQYIAKDDAGNDFITGQILARITDVANGTEDGSLEFSLGAAGVNAAGTDYTLRLSPSLATLTGSLSVSGSISNTGGTISDTYETANNIGPTLQLIKERSNAAQNDDYSGGITFGAENSADENFATAVILATIPDVLDAMEDGALDIYVGVDGVQASAGTSLIHCEGTTVTFNGEYTFPSLDGTAGQLLSTDGANTLSWATNGAGDVVGPAGATDNAIARYDTATGKLLQDSVVIVGNTGVVTGITDLTASGNIIFNGGTFAFNASQADKDFHVNGDGALVLTIDADTDRIILDEDASGQVEFYANGVDCFLGGSVTINEDGADEDFRVEGDNNTHALFVDGATDHVKVGTEDYTTYTAQMEVFTSHATGYAGAFVNDANAAGAFGIVVQSGRHTIQGGDYWINLADRDNGVLGGIQWDGSDPGFYTASDKRLKANVRDSVRDALAVVRQVRFRDFERHGQTVRDGFTAQELELLMPDAVTTRTINGEPQMFVSLSVVDRYYRQAVTQMANENEQAKTQRNLQARQIEWLRTEAEGRGVDMSTFPLE